MALTKTPTTMVSNQTISAGGTYTSPSALDLGGAIDFAIGYTMAFNAATNGGARIELFADPTAANSSFSVGTYDDCMDSWDIASDAGHTVNGMIPFNRSARYVKVKITNLGNQSITGAYIYGIVQAQA